MFEDFASYTKFRTRGSKRSRFEHLTDLHIRQRLLREVEIKRGKEILPEAKNDLLRRAAELMKERTLPEETYEIWHHPEPISIEPTQAEPEKKTKKRKINTPSPKFDNLVESLEYEAKLLEEKLLKEQEERVAQTAQEENESSDESSSEGDTDVDTDSSFTETEDIEDYSKHPDTLYAERKLKKWTKGTDTSRSWARDRYNLAVSGWEFSKTQEDRDSVAHAHIANLQKLLHINILRQEWDLAYQAFSLLVRFDTVDVRNIWPLGIEILNRKREDMIKRNVGSKLDFLKSRQFLDWLALVFPVLPSTGVSSRSRFGLTFKHGSKRYAPLFVAASLWELLLEKKYSQLRDALDERLLLPPYSMDGGLHFIYMLCCLCENIHLTDILKRFDENGRFPSEEEIGDLAEDMMLLGSKGSVEARLLSNYAKIKELMKSCENLKFDFPKEQIEKQIEKVKNYGENGSLITPSGKAEPLASSTKPRPSRFAFAHGDIKHASEGAHIIPDKFLHRFAYQKMTRISWVWRFFLKIDESKAKCLRCDAIVPRAMGCSTTLLSRHLHKHGLKKTMFVSKDFEISPDYEVPLDARDFTSGKADLEMEDWDNGATYMSSSESEVEADDFEASALTVKREPMPPSSKKKPRSAPRSAPVTFLTPVVSEVPQEAPSTAPEPSAPSTTTNSSTEKPVSSASANTMPKLNDSYRKFLRPANDQQRGITFIQENFSTMAPSPTPPAEEPLFVPDSPPVEVISSMTIPHSIEGPPSMRTRFRLPSIFVPGPQATAGPAPFYAPGQAPIHEPQFHPPPLHFQPPAHELNLPPVQMGPPPFQFHPAAHEFGLPRGPMIYPPENAEMGFDPRFPASLHRVHPYELPPGHEYRSHQAAPPGPLPHCQVPLDTRAPIHAVPMESQPPIHRETQLSVQIPPQAQEFVRTPSVQQRAISRPASDTSSDSRVPPASEFPPVAELPSAGKSPSVELASGAQMPSVPELDSSPTREELPSSPLLRANRISVHDLLSQNAPSDAREQEYPHGSRPENNEEASLPIATTPSRATRAGSPGAQIEKPNTAATPKESTHTPIRAPFSPEVDSPELAPFMSVRKPVRRQTNFSPNSSIAGSQGDADMSLRFKDFANRADEANDTDPFRDGRSDVNDSQSSITRDDSNPEAQQRPLGSPLQRSVIPDTLQFKEEEEVGEEDSLPVQDEDQNGVAMPNEQPSGSDVKQELLDAIFLAKEEAGEYNVPSPNPSVPEDLIATQHTPSSQLSLSSPERFEDAHETFDSRTGDDEAIVGKAALFDSSDEDTQFFSYHDTPQQTQPYGEDTSFDFD